jgi:phosphoenolpyruvate phosphomutase
MSETKTMTAAQDAARPATRFAALRQEIASPTLSFLMEAHNGLSAKIAEEAGFRGIWASGLTMSAALGLRDSNEASWTQVLEVLEYMADSATVPILVDGDTGYGNFNNVRRLVRKLCQTGIAGVCIEDKLFPRPIPSSARPSPWPTSTSSAGGSRPARTARRTTISCWWRGSRR